MPASARTAALIITPNKEDSRRLAACLADHYTLDQAETDAAAVGLYGRRRYDLIFIDVALLNTNPAPLKALTRQFPAAGVIIITTVAELRATVAVLKAGADEYIMSPIAAEEVLYIAQSLREKQMLTSEIDYLRDQFWEVEATDFVRTKSARMQTVLSALKSVAPTDSTVLLSGESGTGKGVLASLIHTHSRRRDNQFISVHCGAIPDTLIESELFGHEKGAFTGAVRKKMGKFEMANGGTIFMDEVGTLTPTAQIKLLQVLQDGMFNRIGNEESAHTNARVIAATNDDLKLLCDQKRFRKDLYYRLNVFPIEIPPLRDRVEDLPDLIQRFVDHLNLQFQKHIAGVHPEVLKALSNYDWPGNVRELENLVERAYILENMNVLTPESFPLELFDEEQTTAVLPMDTHLSLGDARKRALEDFERQYLKALLSRNNGKINLSATEAGISTRQLHKLMRKYDLRKESFK
jgi:DNA-binding NtrC family response regulator